MKANDMVCPSGGTGGALVFNALSTCVALALPAFGTPALAQCNNQVLTQNAGCASNVSSGMVVNNTTVNANGVQTVRAGGMTNASAINSRGTQNVLAGGSDNLSIVNRGGVQSIASGGVATYTTINSGGTQNVAGTASWATINLGGKQIVSSGGLTNNDTINSGGTQTILSGASDNLAVVLGGGTQQVAGTAANDTLAGGKQLVISGGTAIGTLIGSGGTQSVSSGGSALGATVDSGGTQTVSSGGSATNAVVNGGGVQVVAGGQALGTVVNSGGSAAVTSGGTAVGTIVNPGARQSVANGLAVNTILVGATSSGGSQAVSSGGTAMGTVIGLKARQTVSQGGMAIGAQVTSGGTQTVSGGGAANGTMVSNGGSQQVMGGGTATGSVVAMGGTVTLFVGGTTSSGVQSAPVLTSASVAGVLQIATTSSSVITGNASAVANALMLGGGTVMFTPVDAAGYKTLTINGLNGAGTFDLNTDIANGKADRLVVNGGTGNYLLVLQDSSTTPVPNGTRVMLVGGAANAATFSLPNNAIDIGAKKFALQNDAGQIFLFDTGRLGDAASVSQALPSIANLAWNEQVDQTYARLSELQYEISQPGVWLRAFGERFTTVSADVSSMAQGGGVQFGRDLKFGSAFFGLFGAVAQIQSTVGSNGTANSYPWSAGIYGGLPFAGQWFVKGTLRFLSASHDFTTTGGANAGSYHNGGFLASVGGGRRFSLPGNWTVEPRATLSYLHANSLSYTYDSGMPVQLGGQDMTLASVGLTVSKPMTLWQTTLRPYLNVSGVRTFASSQTVTVAGTAISADTPGFWLSVTAGLFVMLERGMRLSADVGYGRGSAYSKPLAVNVGLSYQR